MATGGEENRLATVGSTVAKTGDLVAAQRATLVGVEGGEEGFEIGDFKDLVAVGVEHVAQPVAAVPGRGLALGTFSSLPTTALVIATTGPFRGRWEAFSKAGGVDVAVGTQGNLGQEHLPLAGVYGAIVVTVGKVSHETSSHHLAAFSTVTTGSMLTTGSVLTTATGTHAVLRLFVFAEYAIAVLVQAGELFVTESIELSPADGAVAI